MRSYFLRISVFSCLLLASAGFSGCSRMGNGKVIKVSAWGDLQENSILVDMIADFQKTHSDVKVELERTPYNQYTTKILTQMAGGIAPDVIFVEVGNFVDMYLRDSLEPLNPYIDADHLNLKDYYPEVIDRFTVDNQTYVIPRDTAPIAVIYYNKNAFDEAHLPYPNDNWNWNQFVATAQKLTKADASGRVTRWGFLDDLNSDVWIYGAGGSYVDNVKHPSRWTFAEDPKTLQGIQFRADLIYKYKVLIPPSGLTAMGGMGASDLFVNGTAAMFLNGIWKTPVFRSDIKNFKWDVAMFPARPDGYRAFPTGGSGYGILKSSKYKKEAWELVKFLSGEEGAKKLAATGLAQPALLRVANSPVFLDGQDPHNKKFLLEAVKYVKYGPMCANGNEVTSGIIGPELDKVWNGTETAADAMAHLKPQLEKNEPKLK